MFYPENLYNTLILTLPKNMTKNAVARRVIGELVPRVTARRILWTPDKEEIS
jgi:hypothetical protein